MKAADVRKGGGAFVLGKMSGTIIRRQMSGRGDCTGILFKVMLYDDLVGVGSSGHVKSIAIKSFDPS